MNLSYWPPFHSSYQSFYTYRGNSQRASYLVSIVIDSAKIEASLCTERNMYVKSFVVGAAGAFSPSKLELGARSIATTRPA